MPVHINLNSKVVMKQPRALEWLHTRRGILGAVWHGCSVRGRFHCNEDATPLSVPLLLHLHLPGNAECELTINAPSNPYGVIRISVRRV